MAASSCKKAGETCKANLSNRLTGRVKGYRYGGGDGTEKYFTYKQKPDFKSYLGDSFSVSFFHYFVPAHHQMLRQVLRMTLLILSVKSPVPVKWVRPHQGEGVWSVTMRKSASLLKWMSLCLIETNTTVVRERRQFFRWHRNLPPFKLNLLIVLFSELDEFGFVL